MSETSYAGCNHLCMRASDVAVSVSGDPVAYPHPGCPVHGSCETYVPGQDIHGNGDRPCADCRGYEDEHNYTAPKDDEEAEPPAVAAAGGDTCEKCGKPMTLFDGTTLAHTSVFDMLVCTEAKAVPGGPAKMSTEEFAAKLAEKSRKALETKDWGTT
jgi:hypothetical protein